MDYTKRGFSPLLQRESSLPSIKPLTHEEIDTMFPEFPGERIDSYGSSKFSFFPTNPSANPREGEVYYDTSDKKLKVFNGSEYEEISST